MSTATVMRAAGGASAFIQVDRSFFSAVGETGPAISRIEDVQGHTWNQVIDDLLGMFHLRDDWDGQGTSAPDRALVAGAITLALRLKEWGLPPADRVIASVNETIYFEWHTPLGYQEIEVTSPLDAECRWVSKDAVTTETVRLSRRPSSGAEVDRRLEQGRAVGGEYPTIRVDNLGRVPTRPEVPL